ncbi:MAG: hypothetical protein Q4B43_01165 [Bacteroidota bacterium]|nr:hypothetical protein [Bacteroidota bacterium]
MYNVLKEIHSGWAYLVLLMLGFVVLNSLRGFNSGKEFSSRDRKIALFGLIVTHIQLLFAMLLYFTSPYFQTMKDVGMGGIMGNSLLRLYLIEHPFVNIVAIILITVGWSKHKTKATDKEKFKSILLMYSIALVLFLSRIPWKAWLS